jgi:hypothetical protein
MVPADRLFGAAPCARLFVALSARGGRRAARGAAR